MPKILPNITLVWNQNSQNFDLAGADYQTLIENLILTANPNGGIVSITLSGVLYNAAAVAAQDQVVLAADQAKLAADTAAEQDVNP